MGDDVSLVADFYEVRRTCDMKVWASGYDVFCEFSCCGHVLELHGNDPYRPRFCDWCGAMVKKVVESDE